MTEIKAPDAPRPAFFQGRTGIVAGLRKYVNRALGRVSYDVHVVNLARQLTTLGFTEAPLQELAEMTGTLRDRHARASACLELAKWHLRAPGPDSVVQALAWVREGQIHARTRPHRQHLMVLELLCLAALGQREDAETLFAKARKSRLWWPDLAFAGANLATDLPTRLERINLALAYFEIAQVTLRDAPDLPLYDRLACRDVQPAQTGGPKVSVILAAYQADDMLRTALRSLQEQTYRNLEILVVDDASPSDRAARIAQEFCARDPRFRFMRMAQNGGAYIARNHALDQATGDYVTLHDADDWSHPDKIASQVTCMQAHPQILGCTSQQARATNDLDFLRWGDKGQCISPNISSFMFRRTEMREHFGYWDTVRLSADNELIRRMRTKFGYRIIKDKGTGPLSFQRDTDSTVTADPVLGINGFRYGARQDYLEAQRLVHARKSGLRYTGRSQDRPFPAPGNMRPDRAEIAARANEFDVIMATDFRMRSQASADILADIDQCQAKGLRVAVFSLYRYLGTAPYLYRLEMDNTLRRAFRDRGCRILCYGEQTRTSALVIHDPACCLYPQRYVPTISAARAVLVLPAAAPQMQAMSLPAACSTIAAGFAISPLICPRDAAIRQALAPLAPDISLAAADWDRARGDLPGLDSLG